jgi:5'-methylthioadenosine phosphorylase
MLGITGGVGFFGAEVFKKAQIQKIETPYGPVEVLEVENIFFLPRHGIKGKVPPHMVNHHANMFALKNKGITKIIGMNSVGSLKLEIIDKGIYVQTKGPRLETRAEVSMLCNFADVVGMTMASEATLARESGLTYASMCSVDNYANGIVDEPLDNDKILANATVNGDKIRDFIFKAQGELQ